MTSEQHGFIHNPSHKKKVAVYEQTVPTRTSVVSPLWRSLGEKTQFLVIEKAVFFFVFVGCTCYNNHGLSEAVRLHKVHQTNRCANKSRPTGIASPICSIRDGAIWTSSAPVQHRHGVLHKQRQHWMSPLKLLSKASEEASQIRSHGIFHILHSALCQPVALRVVQRTPLNLDIHTCQFQRCRTLVCTLCWHNGCKNPTITVALADQNRGSRRLLQQVFTFIQVT